MGDPTQRKSTVTTKTRRTATLMAETNTSDKEDVREVLSSQDFDNDTVRVLGTVKNLEVNRVFPIWPIVKLLNLCFPNS